MVYTFSSLRIGNFKISFNPNEIRMSVWVVFTIILWSKFRIVNHGFFKTNNFVSNCINSWHPNLMPLKCATSLVNDQVYVSPSVGDHSFSTFSFSTQNFPKNLNILSPDTHTYVCVSGVRNVNFPKGFAKVLNEWSLG